MRLHNRLIKGGFWNDPDLLQWVRDKRWFYEGLIQLADDGGCLEDSPFAFKISLFASPVDADITVDVLSTWVTELIEQGKLIPYVVDGKRYLFIRNFRKHQQMKNYGAPEVPLPPWITFTPSGTNKYQGAYTYSDPEYSLELPYSFHSDSVEDASKGIQRKEIQSKSTEESSPAAPTTPAKPYGRKKPTQEPDEEAYRLCELLRGLILTNNPTARVRHFSDADAGKWAGDMQRLIRIDGRDPPDIERVIRWCQSDDFWMANILSPGKLRQKWDTLWMQMQRPTKEERNVPANLRPPSAREKRVIEPLSIDEFNRRYPGRPARVPDVQGGGLASDAGPPSGPS